jgi:hypothetical protein
MAASTDGLVEASLPKPPDRSHLADAIHAVDLIRLVEEEVPAARATIERSKAAALTARMGLRNISNGWGGTRNSTRKR